MNLWRGNPAWGPTLPYERQVKAAFAHDRVSNSSVTLLGRFEKAPSRWSTMPYVNIHDGSPQTLHPPTLPVLVQTFEMVFAQYIRHSESKSLAPDGVTCKSDTSGLLGLTLGNSLNEGVGPIVSVTAT